MAIIPFSYWEQQSFMRYDHIVIGSGIVGLNVAISLKDKFPLARILVLERGLLTTGATSRNAGFACMGSVTELLDDLECSSADEVVQLFEDRKKGLEGLKKRLAYYDIGYVEDGSHELITQKDAYAVDEINKLNALLQDVTHKPAFKIANEKIAAFGFTRGQVHALIENTLEGSVNTGRLLVALQQLCMSRGIEIKTGATVTKFEEENDRVTVSVTDGFRDAEWLFSCKKLTICTNAFTNKLITGPSVTPGRGQVLITKPIKDLKFKGIFHFDKGYYYFREIDGRVLFGGGRNMDINTEATTDFALNPAIQNDLDQKLSTMILPETSFEIDMRWTGIMAFGDTKKPIVKAFSKNVFGAYRMGGMGVALAYETANKLAALITEDH